MTLQESDLAITQRQGLSFFDVIEFSLAISRK